jgi:hypothetical protein
LYTVIERQGQQVLELQQSQLESLSNWDYIERWRDGIVAAT